MTSPGAVSPAVAERYREAGLAVLPAALPAKRPAIRIWKTYQARLPTGPEIQTWFARAEACCLICGAVSGNLELLDFDCAGEAFATWSELVAEEAPGLLDRLVVETSPSGGWHVVYRCSEPVCGNIRLAARREDLDGPDPVERFGKRCTPRQDSDGRWHIVLTLIETRGEGGLFLCHNPADLAAIEVVFLNGQEAPTIETADADFSVLGIQMRGYHDFGAALQESRAAVKAKGEA